MNEQCNDDRLSSHEGREYEPSENFDDACAASVLASADSNNGTSSLSEVRRRRFPISPPGTVPLQRETRDENKTIELNASNKAVGEKTTNEGRQEMVSPPSIPAFAVLWVSLIGACLYCMSLLLVGFGQLAFLAIAPWAWLTLDARSIRCSGVLILWLVGVFTWIVLEQGQALTWPVDSGANVLLLLVLGLFLPCFVLMGRWFRSLFHLPAYLTLPIAWCATEYIRSTCLSGLSIGLLAHAAAESRRIIQVIDLFGSYGLGMLMVASGSSLAEIVWVSRRLRGLESTQAHSSDASSGDVKRRGGSFHSLGFGTRQGRHSAQKSMLAVLRRKRDHARDVYLVSGVFSLFLLVGILVFANVYGKERSEESKAWRMFESHLYEVAVFSGESDSRLFNLLSSQSSQSLLVGFFEKDHGDLSANRPVVVIHQSDGDKSSWSLRIGRGIVGRHDSTITSKSSSVNLKEPIPLASGESVRVMGKEMGVPLNMISIGADSFDVEQILYSALQREHQSGDWIDLALVVIEPSSLDGTSWPNLLLRSVLAASIANRCPLICTIPGQVCVVANGDGGLWWSTSESPQESEGDPLVEGQAMPHPIRVHALMDPRSSLHVSGFGRLPRVVTTLAIVFCLCYGTRRMMERGNYSASNTGRISDTALETICEEERGLK